MYVRVCTAASSTQHGGIVWLSVGGGDKEEGVDGRETDTDSVCIIGVCWCVHVCIQQLQIHSKVIGTMIMALKGAIQDVLQSLHCTTEYFQH